MKRNVHDPRNSLVFEFARLICETQPQTLIMENVPGILDMTTPDGTPVVERFCQILKDGHFNGIDAFETMIAKQYGRLGVLNQPGRKKKKKISRQHRKTKQPKPQK